MNVRQKNLQLDPWVMKHKPLLLEDLFLDKKLKFKFLSMKKNRNIPNLILSGPPGSGKTSGSL